MSQETQFCTFYLDHYLFGVEVPYVQEIIRYHEMTPVPLAPDVVSGLINLRGQIVTAFDLRKRLQLTPRPEQSKPINIIIRMNDEAVSFLVDEIGDVLEADIEVFEPPPETLQGENRELIKGSYKLDERLMLHLDTDKIVNINTDLMSQQLNRTVRP